MFMKKVVQGDLQYFPCRYGLTRVVFRGPVVDPDYPFIAFFGGSETYGPFVEAPYPLLVSEALGPQAMNLGVKNGGPDVFLRSPDLAQVVAEAQAVVVQTPVVANLSNRFYKVHPFRNDRFLQVTDDFRDILPQMDVTEVHFVGHFWRDLLRIAPQEARLIAREVQTLWVQRMQTLLRNLPSPLYLLWIDGGPVKYPPLTDAMMGDLAQTGAEVIKVRPSQAARVEGASLMIFAPEDSEKAKHSLNTSSHKEVAQAVVAAILETKKAHAV